MGSNPTSTAPEKWPLTCGMGSTAFLCRSWTPVRNVVRRRSVTEGSHMATIDRRVSKKTGAVAWRVRWREGGQCTGQLMSPGPAASTGAPTTGCPRSTLSCPRPVAAPAHCRPADRGHRAGNGSRTRTGARNRARRGAVQRRGPEHLPCGIPGTASTNGKGLIECAPDAVYSLALNEAVTMGLGPQDATGTLLDRFPYLSEPIKNG